MLEIKKAFATGIWVNVCENMMGTESYICSEVKAAIEIIYSLDSIKEVIGQMYISWGPGASQTFLDPYVCNCLFGAKKSTQDVLYISIAGTTNSLFTKFSEDLNLKTQVEWPYNQSSTLHPKISQGMINGLQKILQIKGEQESTGEMVGVVEYLKNEVIENAVIEVHITGHSLGGNLALIFGLFLIDNRDLWDPNGTAVLRINAFANYSPGDSDFEIYYRERTDDITTRTWNNLDIVPKMFNSEDMKLIPSIYEPYIQPNILIILYTKIVGAFANNMPYYQVLPDAPPLLGRFKDIVFDQSEVGGNMIYDFLRFYFQQSYQHVSAYFDLLGLSILKNVHPCLSEKYDYEKGFKELELIKSKMQDFSFSLKS